MGLQIRRGLQADLQAANLLVGEPAFCTDTKVFMIGDGGTGVIIPSDASMSELLASLADLPAVAADCVEATAEALAAVASANSLVGSKLINAVINGSFENDGASWSDLVTNTGTVSYDTVKKVLGAKSIKLNVSSKIEVKYQEINCTSGDKFYISGWVLKESGTGASFYALPKSATTGAISTLMSAATFDAMGYETWTRYSGIATTTNAGIRIVFGRTSNQTYIAFFDGLMAVNLTTLFGAGLEPTVAEFETLLAYFPSYWFDGAALINDVQLALIKEWKLQKAQLATLVGVPERVTDVEEALTQSGMLDLLDLENPYQSKSLTNLITNGDFTTAGTTGWSTLSTCTFANTGNKFIVTGNGAQAISAPMFALAANKFHAGDYIYISCKFTARTALVTNAYVSMAHTNNTQQTIQATPAIDTEYVYHGIKQISSSATTGTNYIQFCAQYANTTDSNGSVVEWDDLVIINLTQGVGTPSGTDVFGAGNEPNIAAMNVIINAFTGGSYYFEGEQTVPIINYLEGKFWVKNADGTMALKTLSELNDATPLDLASLSITDNTIDGDALINSSVSANKANFIEPGTNLYDLSTATSSKYINYNTGALASSALFAASDYIAALPLTAYVHNKQAYVAYYNSALTYIGWWETPAANTMCPANTSFTTPADTAFIRASMDIANVNTYQLELGITPTLFKPYYHQFVKRDKRLENSYENMLALPPTLYAVVGKELNIYLDNLVVGKASEYDFDVVDGGGAGAVQQNERIKIVPSTAGTYSVVINIYQHALLVNTATTSVIVKAANAGTGTKTLMVIGDSTTNEGWATKELLTLFGGSEAMDLTLLGTREASVVGAQSAENKHEGRSGWTSTHYVSATGPGATNAFWDGSAFNFTWYMGQQSYSAVDYVILNLGINDMFLPTSDTSLLTAITTVLANYDTIVASIIAFSASIKIGIAVTIPPAANQDAFGHDYLAGQTRWRYKRNNIIWVKALIDHFAGQQASNIYLVPINVNLDTTNNMYLGTAAAVNSRSTIQVARQTNGVHPVESGYYQIADEYYYWLKGMQ